MTANRRCTSQHDILPVLEHDDYATFRDLYLIPNQPVMFSKDVTARWTARTRWVKQQPVEEAASGGEASPPAWDYLLQMHGEELIQVIECDRDGMACSDDRQAAEQPSTFGQLVQIWRQGQGRNLYLKDWHLARELARAQSDQRRAQSAIEDPLYSVPGCWQDDWMNEYYTTFTEDDFRFVYAGGGNTFTPLHRDVYTSYSVSTNICGSKRWYMFPPHLTPTLLPMIKSAENTDSFVDVSRWPDENLEEMRQRGMLVILQQEGETIFVPSGWYHSVVNLTHPTISLNHNWCNAHNITSLYNSMCDEVARCRVAIDDVRELLQRKASPEGSEWREQWEACVSGLVRQSAGWDWMTMWNMIKHALDNIMDTLGGQSLHPLVQRWPAYDRFVRPPPEFVIEKVSPIVSRFLARPEAESKWTPGLQDVLNDVSALIHQVTAALQSSSGHS